MDPMQIYSGLIAICVSQENGQAFTECPLYDCSTISSHFILLSSLVLYAPVKP